MTTHVLTTEVAEKFLKDSGSVDLDVYTALDSQAAAALAASTVDLCLNGLDEINEEAAKALIPHVGAISLEGLARLSLGASQSLAEHVGPLRGVDLLRFVGDYPAFSALRRHPSLVAKVLEDDSLAQMLKTKDIDHKYAYEFEFADAASKDLADEEYYGKPMDEGLRLLDESEGKPVWSIPLSSVKDSWVCDNAERYTLYFIGDREDVLRRLAELPNRVLTKDLATQWSEDSDSVDLSAYGELSADAGETLAKSEEGSYGLYLDGLTTLSPGAAEALAKQQGELALNGLTSISEKAAGALAEHKGVLSLCGLTTLSDKAAEALAKHQGELGLRGVTMLSDAAIAALAKHHGRLILNSLKTLSDAAAGALAKHQGALSLCGLTSLSETAAETLAEHQGKLTLDGLTALSDSAFEALAKHEGGLNLNGLKTLSDTAAEALARYCSDISLDGLPSLSDVVVGALAKHQGELSLWGLTSLTDSEAEVLAKHKGGLNLNGLETLSDSAAAALAEHQGRLLLSGLKTLSNKAAEALAKHEGRLTLRGLKALTKEAEHCLRSHPDISLPESIGQCTIVESADQDTKLSVTCSRCGSEQIITCVTEILEKWLRTEGLIQDLMPNLTADEREILISGVCGECFDKEPNT
jgi:hypothetical protein